MNTGINEGQLVGNHGSQKLSADIATEGVAGEYTVPEGQSPEQFLKENGQMLTEELQKNLFEVQAYQEAFQQRTKNPDKLTKAEKKQLDTYNRSPITRAEFNQTIYGIGSDFGKVLMGYLAVEKYLIDTIGEEKYNEYRSHALGTMQGSTTDQNDQPTESAE